MSGAAAQGDPRPAGRREATRPIRLLIVDDSIVARSILARSLEARREFEVVGTAAGVDQALAILDATSVDIVLLDVAMPGIDGLTALPEILRRGGGARVLIVSAIAEEGAEGCLRALTLGAADTLPKPSSARGGFSGRFDEMLRAKLLRIGHAEGGAARIARKHARATAFTLRAPVTGPIACLGIGASTGGIHALTAFFKTLPARVTVPILVTQHLPPTFMPYLASQLGDQARRPATVARDGERVLPGQILVAPGDAHLGLVDSCGIVRVRLEHGPAPSACLPSVDPMLAGLATCYGVSGVAVILSGMGRDGVLGAAQLCAAGGEVLAQDEASSVVWGMPGAVATAGLASYVGAPAALGAQIGLRAGIAAGAPRWK